MFDLFSIWSFIELNLSIVNITTGNLESLTLFNTAKSIRPNIDGKRDSSVLRHLMRLISVLIR